MTERATPRVNKLGFWGKYADEAEIVIGLEYARQLERELTEAREESLEQARLLGMSGQREARLLSDLAEAKDEIARLNQSLKSASLIYDEAKEQRDRLAEVIKAAAALIAAKGWHNTSAAYEELRNLLKTFP